MTDAEIIKAFTICAKQEACEDCPLGDLEGLDKCMHTLLLNALDLINRQQAEIEVKNMSIKGLNETIEILRGVVAESKYVNEWYIQRAKSEAVKEFAERLENKLANNTDISAVGYLSVIKDIDNLLKEMG